MIRQCCECRRVWQDDQWVVVPEEQLDGLDVSHGYCDECFIKQMKIIHDLEKVARAKTKRTARRFAF